MKGSAGTGAHRSWSGDGGRGRGAANGSFILDRHGTVLGFDQGMEALTGWPATVVVGHHKDLGGARAAEGATARSLASFPLYEGSLHVPESTARSLELRLYCRDGSSVLTEARVERMAGPGERMQVKILRVLARSSVAVGVPGIDNCDELTGLLDRNAFVRRLDREFVLAGNTANPLALVVADVDHLRAINDQLGHEGGTEILRKLAGILRVTVGDEERIGRLGEDEFGVVLAGSGRGEARQVAASLRTTVERFRFFGTPGDPQSFDVTLSIGSASFPADADNAADLLDRAYEALEEARALGRNRVWCYMRRPRVPVEVPVFFDAAESLLVGYTRDLSPSGVFVQTSAPIDIGMRCALAFPLPGTDSRVHVVGRVVRAVPAEPNRDAIRIPGMGVEFERFGGPQDRRAIESFLHANETRTLRPENGIFSV